MAAKPRSNKQILIVTGAHLSAEVYDRPLAYRLRQHILDSLATTTSSTSSTRPDSPHRPDRVVVCSDLWYLNRDALRELPTVSVGGPGVNALTAYLADKLPSAFAVDGQFVVQGDFEKAPLAACWGIDAHRTAAAVEVFTTRCLEPWLGAVPA